MCTLIAECLWALAACEPDVVRPGAEALFVQAGQQAEVDLLPDADTYVSRTEPGTNFGTDTILRLDGDRRPLLRWDSLTLAEAVGGDSLIEARLELQVLANGQGWGTVGRRVGAHGMSRAWEETEAFWGGCGACDASFCFCHDWHMDDPRASIRETDEGYESYWDPWNREATDSLVVTNGDDGVVAFDVTADVLGVLTGGPYRQGWLLKKEDENAGGAVDFGSRESGSPPRLVLTLASGDTVPMEAPDHRPDWFRDPEFHVECEGLMNGTCLIDVVRVRFVDAATQAERQAAVDMVQGTVIGGTGAFGYYVQIPHDGTTGPLGDAIESLRALPQVLSAHPYSTDPPVPGYLRPHDGVGWRDWQIDPDLAAGENWALETIAAPMAWGCDFGSDDTRIGVIDIGFHDVSTLSRNLDTGGSVGFGAYAGQDTIDHGTRVAALALGHGNDSTHVTGMMWRASALLQDITVSPQTVGFDEVFRRMREAGENGARIINISLGARWDHDPSAVTDTVQQRIDEEHVKDWYDLFRQHFDALANQDLRPLIVFSAGNEGIDARWNAARIAADSAAYRDQVLVMGASDAADGLAPFSNHGSLVQAAAPGAGVWVLHGDSVVATQRPERGERQFTGYGTSFAAPLATGTAGLLASFDPDLSAAELKHLVLEGASRGGRTADGIPILNAYESLRAAAEREGGPLCGNRVWAADGQIVAQRDRELDTREVLYDSGGDLTNVHVFHGGRRIELRDSSVPGNPALAYDPASREWPTTTEPATTKPGGTLRSWEGTSHDGDRFLEVTSQTGPSQDTHTFRVSDATGTSEPVTVSVPLSQATSLTCVHTRDGECVRTVITGRRESTVARSGLSPMGDWAAVAVNLHVTRTLSVSPFSVCPFPPADEDEPEHCREVHSERTTSGSRMFRADLQSLQSTQIGELADALFYVGVSEDGEEFVSGERSSRQTSTFRALENGVWTTVSDPQEHTNCQIAYRSSASPTDARLLIPSPDVCSIAWTGTVSPERGVGDIELTSR